MPAAIVPAIGAASTVASTIGSKNAQKKAQQAASQSAGAQSQLLGAEAGGIDQLFKQYFGGTVPAENRLMQFLGGQLGQNLSNPGTTAMGQAIGQLQNFKGLKPEEMAALQTSLGNSGRSSVNTLMSQLGGTANPNALAQQLFNQNNENALNSTVQLGNLGAQQELGAQQYAGQLGSSLSEQNLQNQGQVLSGLGNLFGNQSALLGSGLSGLNNIANQYGYAGQQAASNAASYGNPFASGLGSLAGQFGGMFGGGSGGGGGLNLSVLQNLNTAPIAAPGVGGRLLTMPMPQVKF